MLSAQVIDAVVRRLKADQPLVAVLGGQHIYRNRSRATIQNPSVTYTQLWGSVTENYAPMTVQFDMWAKSMEKIYQIEARLYALLHSDLPVEFGGLRMWSQLESGFDYLEEDQGDYHKGITFRFIPARLNG